MRMIKYITLDQLIFWTQSTAPFTFEGVQVNPSQQWTALNTVIKPFLDGSLDNPYSTTTPKEKLPEYFTTAAQIGSYLNDEYGDRLVAVPFRVGEFYYKLNRNLNKDEAMEIIMQELLSKAYNFVSVYGYQFLKLIGTASISYNPIWNVDGTEKRITDYGVHITTDEHGNKQQTQTLGPTSKSNTYGQVQLTDVYGKKEEDITYGTHTDSTQYGQVVTNVNIGNRTDTHSETQMNDLTFKNKAQDAHSAAQDSQTVNQHTDSTTFGTHTDNKTEKTYTDTHTTAQRIDGETTTSVTNTIADATFTDTNTSGAHQVVDTFERHGNIGVTSTQDLISQERALLDFNPALEFFEAFINKICLRAYYY